MKQVCDHPSKEQFKTKYDELIQQGYSTSDLPDETGCGLYDVRMLSQENLDTLKRLRQESEERGRIVMSQYIHQPIRRRTNIKGKNV